MFKIKVICLDSFHYPLHVHECFRKCLNGKSWGGLVSLGMSVLFDVCSHSVLNKNIRLGCHWGDAFPFCKKDQKNRSQIELMLNLSFVKVVTLDSKVFVVVFNKLFKRFYLFII